MYPSQGNRQRRRNGRSRRQYSQPNAHARSGAAFGPRRRHTGAGFRARAGVSRNGRRLPTFDPSRFINTKPVSVPDEVYTPIHTFDSFGLGRRLVLTAASLGMVAPTPIQDQIIPHVLRGKDVIGLAETGTGKTAAFLLPLIERTLNDRSHKTLVLAPTRELAVQINDELRKLSAGTGIRTVVCVGGVSIRPQIAGLRKSHQFVIGTPGRVVDLMEQRQFRPEHITAVVLDEADRMLDMGFIMSMRTILGAVPARRQTLFFSATMDREASKLVGEFLREPVSVSVKKTDVASSIEQDVVRYDPDTKLATLISLLRDASFTRVLVFGAMKHAVKRLAEQLDREGVRTDSIHGNKNHSQRQAALRRFKSGEVRVLVATDVAARGIHVEDVSHVINYDLPSTFEDYVHRIGRTGRAAKRGKALTFVPAESAFRGHGRIR